MANNYVTLTLDTTPPKLEIYAPSFTTRTARTPITVEANERIGKTEIFILDSEGSKHKVTFDRRERLLDGEMSFNSFPLGISSLNVQVTDDVDNTSDLYTHSFNIVESEILTSEMSLQFMSNQLTTEIMNQDMSLTLMKNEMAVTG